MERHVVWASMRWLEYFKQNEATLRSIPWDCQSRLSPPQRDAIATSVQEFQLGESSEARHLLAEGRAYSRRSGDAGYADALAAFVAEEHRHSRDLKRFMLLEGIAPIARAWPDIVFRWLRHRAGLELSIVVLVTAEIIAKVYYAALREATESPTLRRLCDQILADEEAHVRFQCERIAVLRRQRPRCVVHIEDLLHRVLMFGTCLVVWRRHGRAMRAGNVGFLGFLSWVRRERSAAARMMDPVHSEFTEFDAALVAHAPERPDADKRGTVVAAVLQSQNVDRLAASSPIAHRNSG